MSHFSNKVEPLGIVRGKGEASEDGMLLHGKQQKQNRQREASAVVHSMQVQPGESLAPISQQYEKGVRGARARIQHEAEEWASKAVEGSVKPEEVEKNALDHSTPLPGRRSIGIRNILSRATTNGTQLKSEILAGHLQVKDTERAVLFKVHERMKEEHALLPPIIASDRFTYRMLEGALVNDDGRWGSMMTAFGEKVKEVVESSPEKVRMQSAQVAKQRMENIESVVEKISSNVKTLMSSGLAQDEAKAAEEQTAEARRENRGDSVEDVRQNARLRPVTLKDVQSAAAVLGTELEDQLEDLTNAVEVACRRELEKWRRKRAPIYEKITQHEKAQRGRSLTTSTEDRETRRTYEDLPEMQELMRIFPFKIATDMRDKFGNYTVMFVPHVGGSKMSEIWHHMTDPDRFAYLLLVLNEYTAIIDDVLIRAEKRFLGANWIWDLQGSSAWSNVRYGIQRNSEMVRFGSLSIWRRRSPRPCVRASRLA